LSTLWKTKAIDTKMGLMLNGPGWQPGKSRLGLNEDIPDVSRTQIGIVEKLYLFIHNYSNG